MFFQQHIRSIPNVNANFWSFSIGGKVRQPLILSYADLRALPSESLRCAIACAGENGDYPLIGEAVWHGTALQTLLDELEIEPSTRYARVSAADGYTTVLPLDVLTQTLLVTAMDDTPLPPEHGYPARLIAPGLHGYKMPKWIERIELTELTDSVEGGFWEAHGGSLDGTASVKAAITGHEQAADGTVAFSGVAYASGQALAVVQISIDGGDWMPVAFTITPESQYALANWRIDWTPPGKGDYHVTVRASDGHADAQHSRIVRIR